MRVLTIGSINLDHVLTVDHLVRPGETLAAGGYARAAGGKGLNQSIAAARAGARVAHAGIIGHEGAFLRDLMAEAGCDVSLVRERDVPQGAAYIQVDARTGENSIVIVAGSNAAVTPAFADEALDTVGAGDVVLVQNEVTSMPHILSACAERHIPAILNPAPYTSEIGAADLSAVSWLVVNEVELALMTGTGDADEAMRWLERRAPGASLLVTLGSKGCLALTGDGTFRQAARRVAAVDTTGAGDTFIGYFLAGLAEGKDVPGCLELATAAAAIAVSRPGAAPSIPWRIEVDELLGSS